MRKFKHKKLNWIAEHNSIGEWYSVADKNGNIMQDMLKELIEDSNDWEEITEEDWIDRVIDRFHWRQYWQRSTEIRAIIERYQPKITQEDLDRLGIRLDWQRIDLIELLESKGLFKE